jgi:hypothetical protein
MPNRTENAASKAVGAIKSAKATIKGLSGVFKQLTEEHGEVSALLMRVKTGSDQAVRRELFPKIRAKLLSHERGELLEVYPVFERHPELQRMAAEHNRDAKQLERLLEGLNTMAFDDEAWDALFGKLVEVVKQHAAEEESVYFPEANRVLGKEESERINGLYERAKAAVLQQV